MLVVILAHISMAQFRKIYITEFGQKNLLPVPGFPSWKIFLSGGSWKEGVINY